MEKPCKCNKCGIFTIEYDFELEGETVLWCRFCWAEWWARGITVDDPELFVEEYKQTLESIRKNCGADPDGPDKRNV